MGKTPEIVYRKIGRYGNFSAKSVCRRFVKIEAINEHIGNREIYREANRSGKKISPLGAENEYSNAEMLAKAGWPVLKPLGKNKDPMYPLLLYPVVSDPALFDIQEEAYITGTKQLTQTQINQLAKYNL